MYVEEQAPYKQKVSPAERTSNVKTPITAATLGQRYLSCRRMSVLTEYHEVRHSQITDIRQEINITVGNL